MKSRSSYSKLIDERVFIMMAVCAVIALTVLAFRFKHYEPCTAVEIAVKPDILYAGELIQFKAITNNQGIFHWDFGDDSKSNKVGVTVNHYFEKPGRYEVILNKEDPCNASKIIYVLAAPKIEDKSSRAVFSGPATVEVGTPALFVDSTPNATKWDWRFGETNGVDATKSKVYYTFKTSGSKKVILTVNDKLVGEFMVLVTPKTYKAPAAPKRPSPQNAEIPVKRPLDEPSLEELKEKEKAAATPAVSQEQLQVMLKGIVEGEKVASDLAELLCDKQNMQVTYNDKTMGIDKLCEELRDIRKAEKIRELKINFDPDINTNCIKSMNIKLKKKFLR